MDTNYATPIADVLNQFPPEGPGRDIALQRLAERMAADRAGAALDAAASRVRGTSGAMAEVLAAAAAGGVDAQPDQERLTALMTSDVLLSLLPSWVAELRGIADKHPETGACTIATALQLWSWTARHVRGGSYPGWVAADLASAFVPLLAARCLALDAARGGAKPDLPASAVADLCHVHAVRASSASAATCAEIVFGYRRHHAWDDQGCAACYQAEQLDELEGLIPGIASSARGHADVVEADGSHAAKAGPCASLNGLEGFMRLRARLDGCLTGARLAKDRAAAALGRPS